jgi:hypothetical protein
VGVLVVFIDISLRWRFGRGREMHIRMEDQLTSEVVSYHG